MSRFVAHFLVEIGAILKEINNPNKFNCNKSVVLIYLTSFALWSFFAGVFVFLGKNWLKMLFPPFYQARSRSLLNCSSVHTEKSIFLQRFRFRIESDWANYITVAHRVSKVWTLRHFVPHPNLVPRFSLLPVSRSIGTSRRELWERGCRHPGTFARAPGVNSP